MYSLAQDNVPPFSRLNLHIVLVLDVYAAVALMWLEFAMATSRPAVVQYRLPHMQMLNNDND